MKPKKPKKIKGVRYDRGSNSQKFKDGYNQGLSDMEAYCKVSKLSKNKLDIIVANAMAEYFKLIPMEIVEGIILYQLRKSIVKAIIDAQKEKRK